MNSNEKAAKTGSEPREISPDHHDSEPPIVFVSYAHENREHKNWVRTLATNLREKGVDAKLDSWNVRLGEDFTLFMDQIRKCDRVLLICTPIYARKSNEGDGGVGYERSVITGELAQKIDTSKFVCVLREGNSEQSIPTFAQNRRYIDFRDDSEYEIRLDELLRDLHKAPADPEPPLGVNPYRIDSNNATDLNKERDENETLLRLAERLLSNKDMFGWKRLRRRKQQEIHPKLNAWRESIGNNIDNEMWLSQFNDGVMVAEPLIILALTAVDSEIDSIENQFSLIDDFLHPEDWKPSGATTVVNMPQALAFVYHYLLGAFLVYSKYNSKAVTLLATSVRDPGNNSLQPLWENNSIMGWVESLGGDVTECWTYLRELYNKRPWMSSFFHTEKSYNDCLRAYAFLASMIELSYYIGRGGDIEELHGTKLWLNVPPLFLSPWEKIGTTFDEIVSVAIPDIETLKYIAEAGNSDVTRIKTAWPAWIKQLLQTLGEGYHYRRLAGRLATYAKKPPPLPTN